MHAYKYTHIYMHLAYICVCVCVMKNLLHHRCAFRCVAAKSLADLKCNDPTEFIIHSETSVYKYFIVIFHPALIFRATAVVTEKEEEEEENIRPISSQTGRRGRKNKLEQ